MWLLQLMQQQHSIDMMKKQGLKLEAQDLYNPKGVSLKDEMCIRDRYVGKYYIQIFDSTLANWVGEQPGICTMAKTCGHAGVME